MDLNTLKQQLDLQKWRDISQPYWERFRAAVKELTPRDWVLVAVAFLGTLIVLQQTRMLTRQTRLLVRQADLLEAQNALTESQRNVEREVRRVRLRSGIWKILDLLRPAAQSLQTAQAPDPQRPAAIRESRRILEEEELNPLLVESPESLNSWRSALSAARLVEESLSQANPDPMLFSMQTERIRRDLLNVRDRLALDSMESGGGAMPAAQPQAQTSPAVSPMPIPPQTQGAAAAGGPIASPPPAPPEPKKN
ncbi:MAG: hypothetical protein WC728_01780 [Elusimicrobiota bacterium]